MNTSFYTSKLEMIQTRPTSQARLMSALEKSKSCSQQTDIQPATSLAFWKLQKKQGGASQPFRLKQNRLSDHGNHEVTHAPDITQSEVSKRFSSKSVRSSSNRNTMLFIALIWMFNGTHASRPKAGLTITLNGEVYTTLTHQPFFKILANKAVVLIVESKNKKPYDFVLKIRPGNNTLRGEMNAIKKQYDHIGMDMSHNKHTVNCSDAVHALEKLGFAASIFYDPNVIPGQGDLNLPTAVGACFGKKSRSYSCILMKYYKAGNSAKVLSNASNSAAFRDYFEQVINIVKNFEKVHKRIYTDLKPENIVCAFDDIGQAIWLLIDFAFDYTPFHADPQTIGTVIDKSKRSKSKLASEFACEPLMLAHEAYTVGTTIATVMFLAEMNALYKSEQDKYIKNNGKKGCKGLDDAIIGTDWTPLICNIVNKNISEEIGLKTLILGLLDKRHDRRVKLWDVILEDPYFRDDYADVDQEESCPKEDGVSKQPSGITEEETHRHSSCGGEDHSGKFCRFRTAVVFKDFGTQVPVAVGTVAIIRNTWALRNGELEYSVQIKYRHHGRRGFIDKIVTESDVEIMLNVKTDTHEICNVCVGTKKDPKPNDFCDIWNNPGLLFGSAKSCTECDNTGYITKLNRDKRRLCSDDHRPINKIFRKLHD